MSITLWARASKYRRKPTASSTIRGKEKEGTPPAREAVGELKIAAEEEDTPTPTGAPRRGGGADTEEESSKVLRSKSDTKATWKMHHHHPKL